MLRYCTACEDCRETSTFWHRNSEKIQAKLRYSFENSQTLTDRAKGCCQLFLKDLVIFIDFHGLGGHRVQNSRVRGHCASQTLKGTCAMMDKFVRKFAIRWRYLMRFSAVTFVFAGRSMNTVLFFLQQLNDLGLSKA